LTNFVSFRRQCDGQPALFAYARGTGDAHFLKVTRGGPGIAFEKLSHVNHGPGWTNFVGYQIGGENRYFAYNACSGLAAWCKFRPDGSDEDTLLLTNMTPHWTHFMPFMYQGQAHFLAYSFGLGPVQIWSLSAAHPFHTVRVETNHGPSWTQWMPIPGMQIHGSPLYLAYSAGSHMRKNAAICRVDASCRTGEETLQRHKWSNWWTSLISLAGDEPGAYFALANAGAIIDVVGAVEPTNSPRDQICWPAVPTFQVIPLPDGHAKWNHIQSRLRESLPQACLTRVRRVVNPELYFRFRKDSEALEKQCGARHQCVAAWHATKEPAAICGIMQLEGQTKAAALDAAVPASWQSAGFNKLYSAGGSYGKAAYFARYAKYSHDVFANGDEFKLHLGPSQAEYVLLLAEVSLGNMYDFGDKVDCSLKQPPEGYDSVHGTEASFAKIHKIGPVEYGRQWMVYERFRAYPHYIVEYKL